MAAEDFIAGQQRLLQSKNAKLKEKEERDAALAAFKAAKTGHPKGLPAHLLDTNTVGNTMSEITFQGGDEISLSSSVLDIGKVDDWAIDDRAISAADAQARISSSGRPASQSGGRSNPSGSLGTPQASNPNSRGSQSAGGVNRTASGTPAGGIIEQTGMSGVTAENDETDLESGPELDSHPAGENHSLSDIHGVVGAAPGASSGLGGALTNDSGVGSQPRVSTAASAVKAGQANSRPNSNPNPATPTDSASVAADMKCRPNTSATATAIATAMAGNETATMTATESAGEEELDDEAAEAAKAEAKAAEVAAQAAAAEAAAAAAELAQQQFFGVIAALLNPASSIISTHGEDISLAEAQEFANARRFYSRFGRSLELLIKEFDLQHKKKLELERLDREKVDDFRRKQMKLVNVAAVTRRLQAEMQRAGEQAEIEVVMSWNAWKKVMLAVRTALDRDEVTLQHWR